MSSNSSGYSSNESCVVNEGIADINEDSDCSSQSVTIDKHTETHLNENTRSTEKHLNMDKNSSKIHPIVKMSETTPENEGVGKDSEVTVEQCDSAPCEKKIELDDVSSSSSTSKTSDANCVGISSVDTINESSLVAEKNVTPDGESQMPHILYNLYTISVSILTLYSFLFILFSFILFYIFIYILLFLFIFLFYLPFYSYLFFFIFLFIFIHIFIYVSFINIPF